MANYWSAVCMVICCSFAMAAPAPNAPLAPVVGGPMEIGRLSGHYGAVTALAITPDGKFALSGGADQVVMLWDVASRKCLRVMHGHVNRIASVAITPDGTRGASGGLDGRLCVWDLSNGRLVAMSRRDAHVHSVGLSDDGKLAVGSTCTTGEVIALDVATDALLWTKHVDGQSYAVAISPDGSQIASGTTVAVDNHGHTFASDGSYTLYDHQGQATFTSGNLGPVSRLKFLPDHRLAWIAHRSWGVIDSADHHALVNGSLEDGDEGGDIPADGQSAFGLQPFEFQHLFPDKRPHKSLPHCVERTRATAVSADGNLVLIAGGGSNGIEFGNFAGGCDTDIRVLDPNKDVSPLLVGGNGTEFSFSPDATLAAFGGWQSPYSVIDVATGKKLPAKRPKSVALVGEQVQFTHDGKHFLVYHSNRNPDKAAVSIVDPLTLMETQQWPIMHEHPVVMDVSANDHYCLVARAEAMNPRRTDALNPADKDVQVIDLKSGQRLSDLPTGVQPVVSLVISPDSRFVALSRYSPPHTGYPDVEEKRTVQVWEIATGKMTQEFPAVSGVPALAISDHLLAGAYGKGVLIWDYKTGKKIEPLEGFPNPVRNLFFSHNGSQLIVQAGGIVYFLNADTHDLLAQREIVNGTGAGLQLLPDDTLLAGSTIEKLVINRVPPP